MTLLRSVLLVSCLLSVPALAAAAEEPAANVPPAEAPGFTTSNVQVLYGTKFDDKLLGYNPPSQEMSTLTFNTFSTWAMGDSFFFVDAYRANFAPGANGQRSTSELYAEWHPRLLFANRLGWHVPGIQDFGLAGEVNAGSIGSYYAYLAGLGLNFALPAPYSVGLNVYYKYDKFVYHTWQVSPYWTVPFSIGKAGFLFAGFVDVAGAKTSSGKLNEYDLMAQPELLVDVLAPFGGKANRVYLGVEWYLHRTADYTTSAPQAMVQWTIH